MGHEQMEDGESFCFLAQAVSEQHDPWWQDYWQRPYAHQQSGNDSLEDVGQIVTAERQLFGSAVPPLAKSVRGTGGNQSHGSQAGPFGVPHVARWDEIPRQRSPALRAPTSPASDQLSQAESRQARIPGHRSSRSLGESFWGGVSGERLAVVVADVEVDEEYQFEQPWYASNPEQLHKLAEWLIEQQVEEVVMESTCPILETAVELTRTVLETELSESGRCREAVGSTPPSASVVQSRAARAQERFSRCRTFGEGVDFPGVGLELCARWRTALVADTDPRQVSTEAGQSPSAESTGGTACLVGRSMPARRRDRRCKSQQTLPQGQPSDAPPSQSSCQCCRQTEREHLRDRLSSFSTPTRTQQNHRSYCQSSLSVDLDHSAQGRSL